MPKIPTFDTVLDEVESLPFESQVELLEILQKRVTEHRRTAIVRDVKNARRDHKNGRTTVATPDDIMASILG